MVNVAKSRIQIQPNLELLRLYRPIWHVSSLYSRDIDNRGLILWSDYGMVCVDWRVHSHTIKIISADDIDQWNTIYGVMLNHTLHPAYVTKEGLSIENNRIFHYMH